MDGARGPSDRAPGRPEQREAFLTGAVDHVLRHGVATLSLRPLAVALGTSDRMLLYYFATREALLAAVLTRVGEQLRSGLEQSVPSQRVSPSVLLDRARTALRDPAAEAHLRLYVEVSGLAARGGEPFATMAADVARQWLAWTGDRLDVPEEQRSAAAAGVLAVIDGLLLLRFVAGPEDADRAATWLAPRLDG